MKKLFLLLLLGGAVAAAILNRDKISALLGRPAAEETTEATPEKKSNATPHPATEARAAAIRAYPALGQKESVFNKTFLTLYGQAQQQEPELLARADWPMTIAKRTAATLAPKTATAPRTPAATPWHMQGSSLDKRPSTDKHSPKDTLGLPPR